jgi:hypothetical protein
VNTFLLVFYIIIAVVLFIASLVMIGAAIIKYLDDRDANRNYPEENARNVKDIFITLLGPPAAIAWPLTMTLAALYGGYRLVKMMIADLKENKRNNQLKENT